MAPTLAAADPYRTTFHFQPPPSTKHSVMNDPNGIMRDARTGLFHMFAQFRYTAANFTQPKPSGVGWLHAVSKDALAWTHLPMALRPDETWDCGGVYTGSATFVDGAPVLAYSVECNEVIGLAVPVDASDPLLVEWRKPRYDPIVRHTPDYNFRDPVTAFRPEPAGDWRMAVGCSGHLCTYRSADFVSWRDAGRMYLVPGEHMWECPDVFQLTSTHWVIKASSAPFDEYVVGRFSPGANDSFVKVDGAADIGAAIGAGQLIDAGNVYASKTLYDPIGRRRLLFGWVHEEPGFPRAQNWQGLQTVPRVVSLDPRNDSRLLFRPIDEVASLRQPRPSVLANHSLCAGCSVDLVDEGNGSSRLDVLLRLRAPRAVRGGGAMGGGMNVTLGLLRNGAGTGVNVSLVGGGGRGEGDGGSSSEMRLLVNGTNTSAQWASHACYDANGATPATPFVYCACYPGCGARYRLYADEEELSLRVLLDVSVLEVFAQGGRAVATKRAYLPAGAVVLYNHGADAVQVVSAEAYEMRAAEPVGVEALRR